MGTSLFCVILSAICVGAAILLGYEYGETEKYTIAILGVIAVVACVASILCGVRRLIDDAVKEIKKVAGKS